MICRLSEILENKKWILIFHKTLLNSSQKSTIERTYYQIPIDFKDSQNSEKNTAYVVRLLMPLC